MLSAFGLFCLTQCPSAFGLFAQPNALQHGGLTTRGFGVNWSPIEPLSLNVSYTDEHGAPSISQLNDPTVSTFNVPVFDFATNQTVLVTRTDGGNPNLNSDNRQVWKAGFNLKPWSEADFRVSSTWTYSLTEDAIAAFPTLTPGLEDALPGRVTRDAGGNLISFDARPLNFERFERQDIRTGFNYSRAFGAPNPAAAPLPGAIIETIEEKMQIFVEYHACFTNLWNQRVNAPPAGDLISMQPAD